MLPIFKLYHQTGKEETQHIYVFLNNEWLEDNLLTIEDSIHNLEEAISQKTKEALLFIFQDQELDNIFLQNTPVTFLQQTLHIDDTITIIKSKIIEGTELNLSFPEIYLFAVREEKLNLQEIYDKLTQEDKLPLTKNRMAQFLQNFVRFDVDTFQKVEKDEFTHEDILPYTEHIELIKFPIGQKFIIEKQYPFIVSPFDTFIEDPILAKQGEKLTSTENENLLLQYGIIHDNIIYMCTAIDILNSLKKNKKRQEIMLKIYFPLLYKKKITSLAIFKKKKTRIIGHQQKITQ